MPYKDPEKQRAADRESKRRARSAAVVADAVGELPAPPDRDELLGLLGVQARNGQVTAIRLLLEEYRRDDDHRGSGDLSGIDELARRRAA